MTDQPAKERSSTKRSTVSRPKTMTPVGQNPQSRALARCLSGSWRATPPPWEPLSDLQSATEEQEAALLGQITPSLIGSGAGALAWWRVRHTPLRALKCSARLADTHRVQALRTELEEREIERVLRVLAEQDITPLLVKGWANARLYPARGLRPLGDIDLMVRPQDAARTSALLGAPVDERTTSFIDIKTKLPSGYERTTSELFAASQVQRLRGLDVHLLGAEDHLRLLCLHFLGHGAWRPLWLCDIAALLENRPPDFDWQRCLGGQRTTSWIAIALGLAHHFLGAQIADTPVAERALQLPKWLSAEVLQQWERPQISQHRPHELMISSLRRPTQVWRALAARWPNPIEAGLVMNLPLHRPPVLLQAWYYLAMSGDFGRRLPKLLRARQF